MANNPVKGKDLIDIASVEAELKKVIALFDTAKTVIISLAKESKKALNVKGNTEAQTKAIKEQSTQVEKLTTDYKKLTKSEKEILKLEEKLNQSRSTSADKATELRLAIAEQNKINKQFVTVNTAAEGSIKKVGAQLAQSKRRYSELSKKQRENVTIGGKLLKQIKEQDKEYKKLQIDIGNTGVNVGNYTESIKEAVGASGLFGSVTSKITQIQNVYNILIKTNTAQEKANAAAKSTTAVATKQLTIAQKASNVATGVGSKALRIFKIALASTGIGLIVVALGSLIAFFTRSQRGVDILKKATAGLRAGFDVIIDRLAAFGDLIVSAFEDPIGAIKSLGEAIKKNLLNRIFAVVDLVGIVGRAFSALANRDLTALKEAASDAGTALIQMNTGLDAEQQKAFADAIRGVNAELTKEIALAMQLEGLQIDLNRRQKLFAAQEATSITRTKELTKLVLNKLNADEDRIAAVKEIARIEVGIAEKQLALEKESLAASLDSIAADGKSLGLDKERLAFITAIKNGNIDSAKAVQLAADFTLSSAAGEEALFEIIEKITNLEGAKQSLLQKQATTQKRIGSITREIAAKQSKALLVEAALQKEIVKDQERSVEARIAAAELVGQKEIEASRILLAANTVTAVETAAIIAKAEVQLAATIKKIRDGVRIADEKSRAQEAKERAKELSDKINAIREESDRILKETELALLKAGATEEEIEKELSKKTIELKEIEVEKLKELGQDVLDNELEIQRLRVEADEEANTLILEQRQALNQFIKDGSIKLGQDLVDFAINSQKRANSEELDAEQTKIDEENAILDEQVAAGLKTEEQADAIKEQREEEFRTKENAIKTKEAKTDKANQLFKATVAGIRAVIAAGPNVGLQIAIGIFNAAQIALLAATPIPKFEKGGSYDPDTGMIGGKSHAAGGTKFYDEHGHAVFEAQKGEKAFIINNKAVPFYDWMNSHTEKDIPSNGGGISDHRIVSQLKKNKPTSISQQYDLADYTARQISKYTNNKERYANRYR